MNFIIIKCNLWVLSTFKNNLIIDNGYSVRAKNTSGYDRNMLQMSSSNEMIYGAGSYDYSEGATRVQGNDLHFDFNGTLYANGKEMFGNRVLWSGDNVMAANTTIDLSGKVSEQNSGIVLVWSPYIDGSAKNYGYTMHFVPKYMISFGTSPSFDFAMFRAGNFSHACSKYLYIHDQNISGYSTNTATGTGGCGITYNNAYWHLRYVIGV